MASVTQANGKLSRSRNKSGSSKTVSTTSSTSKSPAPTGVDYDSDTLSTHGIHASQPSPEMKPSHDEKMIVDEAAPNTEGSFQLVTESMINDHVQGKVGFINTYIIKLAALENKSKLMKDCLTRKKEIPDDWRDKRNLPVLPSGISFSFSTILDIDHIRDEFDRNWLSKLSYDLDKNVLPRLVMKIQNLRTEFVEEITRDVEETDIRDLAISFFNTEVEKKMENRAKAYDENQRIVSSTGKKRLHLVKRPQKQHHRNNNRYNPTQHRPPRHQYNNESRNNRHKSAGWSSR